MSQAGTRPSYVRGLLGMVLIVAIVYFAKAVIVPLALAFLLTFVLTPVVVAFQRWGLPRVPAVIATTLVALSVFGVVGWIVAAQLQTLAHDLPSHREEIAAKMARLRVLSSGPLSRISEMIRDIDELQQETGNDPSQPAPQVIVARPARTSTIEQLLQISTPVVEPLATAGFVLVLVIFSLIKREDLRNRFIGLLGYTWLTGTTRVLVDAADRISRFLLSQLLVNASVGLVFAVGLFLMGVPYAFLWGFLMTILRFVPYIGSWLAAGFPLLLTAVTSPNWLQPAMVLVFFGVLDLITANVIEPLLFGHTTGLSPVALLVAAVFWTWIWGPIGLLLSTPLTVCLVVLGQQAPQFKFLALLLGDQPALPPHAMFYQRLLARDRREAEEVARAAQARDPMTVYDEVLLPTLLLARKDRQHTGLSAEDESFILNATREIVAKLPDQGPETATANEAADSSQSAPHSRLDAGRRVVILGTPAHHEAEEISLEMLSQLLKQDGYDVEVMSTKALPSEVEASIDREKPSLLLVAILPPGGLLQAEYLSRRVQKRFPDLKILAGYWGHPRNFDKILIRLRSAGVSYVTTSLLQTRSQILALAAASSESQPARQRSPDISAAISPESAVLHVNASHT